MPSSSSNSPDFGQGFSQLNDEDEEEDKKPNIEYLDSLNAYRKRSRSAEDVGAASKVKQPKVESNGLHVNGHANGLLGVNGYGHAPASNGFGQPYANGNGVAPGFGEELQLDEAMQTQEETYGEGEQAAEPGDDPMVLGTSGSSLNFTFGCQLLIFA